MEGIIEKKPIKITDLLGREIYTINKRSTYIYMYDNGSIEKKHILFSNLFFIKVFIKV